MGRGEGVIIMIIFIITEVEQREREMCMRLWWDEHSGELDDCSFVHFGYVQNRWNCISQEINTYSSSEKKKLPCIFSSALIR